MAHPVELGLEGRVLFPGVAQLTEGMLPNRLQHLVAGSRRTSDDDKKRARNKAVEQFKGRFWWQTSLFYDVARRLGAASSGKSGNPPVHLLLIRGEQVVRPVDQLPKRSVMTTCAGARCQCLESTLHSLQQRAHVEHSHPGCGQLDG